MTDGTLRWLFVVNAIITVVWSIFGFFMILDLPNKPNYLSLWCTKDMARVEMERLERHN